MVGYLVITYEKNAFNKVIAFHRELTREIEENATHTSSEDLKQALQILVQTLAPIAPHIAHELWTLVTQQQPSVVHNQEWPVLNLDLLSCC